MKNKIQDQKSDWGDISCTKHKLKEKGIVLENEITVSKEKQRNLKKVPITTRKYLSVSPSFRQGQSRVESASKQINLVIDLLADLLRNFLALLLLPSKQLAQERKSIRREDQSRRHRRLSLRNNTALGTTVLLNLRPIDLKDVLLAISGNLERPVRIIKDRALDRLGVARDDGELGIERVETGVAERVGFGEVRRDVTVGLLEIREERLAVGVVAGRGDGERLLAVGMRLDGGEGVGDHGVGGEVLERDAISR